MELIGWREREHRLGSFVQYELVIEYRLVPSDRDVYVTIVLRDSDNAEEVFKKIATEIGIGNIESAKNLTPGW